MNGDRWKRVDVAHAGKQSGVFGIGELEAKMPSYDYRAQFDNSL